MATKTGVELKKTEAGWEAPCSCVFHIFDGAPAVEERIGFLEEMVLIGKLSPHWHPCDVHRAHLTVAHTVERGEGEVKYEVIEDKNFIGDWRVEAINHMGDGEIYITVFSGQNAEGRAREYALRKGEQAKHDLEQEEAPLQPSTGESLLGDAELEALVIRDAKTRQHRDAQWVNTIRSIPMAGFTYFHREQFIELIKQHLANGGRNAK